MKPTKKSDRKDGAAETARADGGVAPFDPFASFSEWASEADEEAYGCLSEDCPPNGESV
ncbi:MAG TPA: hypothetical protein VG735_05185 [Caulobacterales bacterium]|jgi:hypothetical protein|nr:hypothetical protein [Caulobacterales bacterium]